MSEENVELVRKGFEAHKAGGIEALLPIAAPHGVWYTAPEWVEDSTYHGHDGLRFLFSVWTDNFDDWTIEKFELRDAGATVVALVEHSGKIKGSSATMRQPMGVVFSDFGNGLIGQARFFQTWDEALEAAGLSE